MPERQEKTPEQREGTALMTSEERFRILRALALGSATTSDVTVDLRPTRLKEGFRLTEAQVRRRLRKLEADGLVDHKMIIGPVGFCTFEWFPTDAGCDVLESQETDR